MLAMMKMILTSQKQALKIKHDKTRDGRVRDHIKSVIHASNGWSAEEIADFRNKYLFLRTWYLNVQVYVKRKFRLVQITLSQQ